jgi:ribosomal protein L40E
VTVVGSVLGFATYPKIGYSVGTTRPITPQKLAELASQARAPGMALCKNVDVYTFENSSTEQIKALAGVGVKRSPRYRPCTGTICPTCASPKGWQAVVCRACWLDNLRAECAVTEHGVERGRYRCYCEPCVEAVRRFHRKKRRRLGLVRGTGTGRPQPASHPWRRKSLLTEGAA